MVQDGNTCTVVERNTVDFTSEPLSLTFNWQEDPCAVAELQDTENGLVLTFNPVPNAVSYFLKLTKIIEGVEPFEFTSQNAFENNQVRVSIDLETATYLFQLQALTTNGTLTNFSDPLTIEFVSVF